MTRQLRARAVSDITEAQWAFLNDALTDDIGTPAERYALTCDTPFGKGARSNADLWRDYGPTVLARWAEDHPSTRPSLWWRYDAPRHVGSRLPNTFDDEVLAEPRRRLGGTGTPLAECSAYGAEYVAGIPARWHLPGQDWSRGVPIDPNDPPLFEAQATYLDRHGQLLPGERARLTAAEYEPESVEIK